MIKTLHVDTGREMRGGQWQVLYLIERLQNAILLAPRDSPLFHAARKRGVDARPLSFGTLLLTARKVELVHAHDARAHSLAAVASGAPMVVSRRVGFPVRRSIASRWKYERARLYLAVSKFVAAQLIQAGIPERKIRVVYDGVPIPKLSTLEPGRIVALAGKKAHVVRMAGVPVHFTSELWHDLSTASVFIYASEMEGLGSAALAAMAAGVPVIASRVGGLSEIVEHERTGLVVNDAELPAAVQRLLSDPSASAEMGRRGRDLVAKSFTVESMVRATLDAYEGIVKC